MNDCKHFKSLVPITNQDYICNTCGWIFTVIHQTDITVKELLYEKEHVRYTNIPPDIAAYLKIKPGDKLKFKIVYDPITHKKIVKVIKDKNESLSDSLRKAIEEWEKVQNES
jgi:hypothetical protein